jgi:hypothetical protein
MSQEPEKKDYQNPGEKFNKVNRKMTILWTGLAVLIVLGIALGIFFANKSAAGQPEGSGSMEPEGTVVINDDGKKVLVDEKGNEIEVLDENPIDTIRQTGNSNLSSVKTDTGSGTAGTAEETVKQPWTNLKDEDYGIEIRTLAAGYDGAFLEDGTDDEVKNVLALLFVNTGDKDIQYAEYAFAVNGKPISFKVSDLPAGQQCVVLEASRHQRDTSEVLELISRVVAPVDMLPGSDKVLPVINDDNTITIMNTTQENLPVVRVFYKYFYEDENTFVGGITYTATAKDVPAGGSVTIAPTHFEANASVIMGTGVYDQ